MDHEDPGPRCSRVPALRVVAATEARTEEVHTVRAEQLAAMAQAADEARSRDLADRNRFRMSAVPRGTEPPL